MCADPCHPRSILQKMLEILPKFFKKHGIEKDACVLVACSGGADSTVLAHLFEKSGQPFALAHVNFGLRGDESDGDEVFVKKLAERFGVPFFSKKVDAKTEAERAKKGIQETARDLRYAFFTELLETKKFDWLAAAHHLDDNLETLLLNLARGGAGLRGLRGMLPVRAEKRLIRPLLETKRAEIEVFALENGISWRHDCSNDSDDYARNFVRHRVLPPFREASKNDFSGLAATFEKLRSADDFLNRQLQKLRALIVRSTVFGFEIRLDDLVEKGVWPSGIELFFEPFGFSASQIKLAQTAEKGAQFLSKNGKSALFFSKNAFQIAPIEAKNKAFDWPADLDFLDLPEGRIARQAVFSVEKTASKNRVFLKKSLLAESLRLRRWQIGDRFQPAGMGGQTKKLQDFFTDQKLSVLEKRHVWILEKTATKEVVWVVGMRPDERFFDQESSEVALFWFEGPLF